MKKLTIVLVAINSICAILLSGYYLLANINPSLLGVITCLLSITLILITTIQTVFEDYIKFHTKDYIVINVVGILCCILYITEYFR